MDEERHILAELVKAKENIKRKFIALKNGEADIQEKVTNTLAPVIDPLNRIHQHQQLAHSAILSRVRQQQYNFSKAHNKVEGEIDKNEIGEKNSENSNYNESKLESWFNSPDLDKTYGPVKLYNNYLRLGKYSFKINEKTLSVDNSEPKIEYPLTDGLLQLIFLKSPNGYSTQDLSNYKALLVETGAHLNKTETAIRKNIYSRKYTNIISQLFSSGGGLVMKLQKNNLVYWDDPNELVVRLRLLLASKAAGNTGVSNEIISIFEELLEAGIIKRIPDV